MATDKHVTNNLFHLSDKNKNTRYMLVYPWKFLVCIPEAEKNDKLYEKNMLWFFFSDWQMVTASVCVPREMCTGSNVNSFTFPSTRKKPKNEKKGDDWWKTQLVRFCTDNLWWNHSHLLHGTNKTLSLVTGQTQTNVTCYGAETGLKFSYL
jgi:hypothetical protein